MKKKFEAREAKIDQFLQDENNHNAGTEAGKRILGISLQELGPGRSIVVDKDGRIIAGNKTQLAALQEGFEKAIVIETEGDYLIVHQRNDLDLSDETGEARALSYFDNRAGVLNYNPNWQVIRGDVEAGVELGDLFKDHELQFEIPNAAQDPLPGTAVNEEETKAKIEELSAEVWNEDPLPEEDPEPFVCPNCGHKWEAK